MKSIFLALIVALCVYEYAALRNSASGDTISEIIWEYSARTWLVPFGLGLLMGHFFWTKGPS